MIERYSFSHIEVDGRTFTSDIIIYPDGRILDSWWRESGHYLVREDIEEVLDARPQILIIGTGASGMMQVDPRLLIALANEGVTVEELPTREAVARYNALYMSEKVAACLHLSC